METNTIVEHTNGLRGIVVFPTFAESCHAQLTILWACLNMYESSVGTANAADLKPIELPFVKFTDRLPHRNRRVMVRDVHGDHYPYGFSGNGDIALSAQYAGFVEWAEIY